MITDLDYTEIIERIVSIFTVKNEYHLFRVNQDAYLLRTNGHNKILTRQQTYDWLDENCVYAENRIDAVLDGAVV